MDIDACITVLQGLIHFFEEYRNNGFENTKDEAVKIALEMGVEPTFRETRVCRKKRFINESTSDEPIQVAEDFFHVNYFYTLLRKMEDESIKNACVALETYLKDGDDSNIDGVKLFSEIILTIPVTVVTAERSFSKLKLIKNYLRSTMSQERLNGLAMLSVEKQMLAKLDIGDLIRDFAHSKLRIIFTTANFSCDFSSILDFGSKILGPPKSWRRLFLTSSIIYHFSNNIVNHDDYITLTAYTVQIIPGNISCRV
ncbi:uncharacterized protein LOC141691518 [Apium graveolens]|uniref:uncharacterized protein LOC141691518 n=1 Tax=Apium graveolens TaxID=4045 RepID=UPI003D7ADD08